MIRTSSQIILSFALSALLWTSRADEAAQPAFCVTGLVNFVVGGSERTLSLSTESARIQIIDPRSDAPANYRAGDVVRVIGRVTAAASKPSRSADLIQVLSHPPPADLPELTSRQIATGEFAGRLAEARGVLVSVSHDPIDNHWNWLTLRTHQGKVCAAATENEYPHARLKELVDAEVRLRGIIHQFDSWRSFYGFHLILNGEYGIQAEAPPPQPPFEVVRTLDSACLHRQSIRGRVLANGNTQTFIKTEQGDFLMAIPIPASPRPVAGSLITARGFDEPNNECSLLIEAWLAPEGEPAQPPGPAETIDVENLFRDVSGDSRVNARYFCRALRLRGTVGTARANIDKTRLLQLTKGGYVVSIDLSGIREIPSDLQPGCEAEIAGICHAEFVHDGIASVFPRFKGITLIPRVETDVRVLRRPPLFTARLLLIAVCILLLVLAASLAWNRSLKILGDRRGRALYREQIHRARAELKVEERTHLAVELYDGLAQSLTGAVLQLGVAANAQDPSVRSHALSIAQSILASCRQELRHCIWDLRSQTLEEPNLADAIRRTIEPYEQQTQITVRCNVPRALLSESCTHTVLKVIRELVSNAVRHGEAAHVKIAGVQDGGHLRFSVCDDGRGFLPHAVPGPAEGHFGLQGIRERLSELGGEMTLRSEPQGGTCIRIVLPLPSESEERRKESRP